jgi:hypothetical protein
MIKDVEELGAEIEPRPLGEGELPLKGNLGLGGSETPQHIAPEIALLALGWGGESGLKASNVCVGMGRTAAILPESTGSECRTGHTITHAERHSSDTEHLRCPKCQKEFVPKWSEKTIRTG